MHPSDCKLSLTCSLLSCRCQTGHRTVMLEHRCEAKTEIFGQFSPQTQLQETTLASSSTPHTQAIVPFPLEQRAFSPKGRSKGVWCCQEQGFWQWNTWSSPDLADPALAGLQSHQEKKWSCGQNPFPLSRFGNKSAGFVPYTNSGPKFHPVYKVSPATYYSLCFVLCIFHR